MEAIFSVFQSLLLLILPMEPVTAIPLGNDQVIANWKMPTSSQRLTSVVSESLEGVQGKYHVYIRHLATGESFVKDQNNVIKSGSLYKMWLAVGVLEEIRIGSLKEDEILSATIPELNEWAGLTKEDAEMTSGDIRYSVSEALLKMISVSHNYSAFLLTREIGNPKVQRMLKEHGLKDMHFVRPPTTSASEMALFLEKVYRGRFFPDKKYAEKLRHLLAANNLNEGLPKHLPEGVRVLHKTGELNEFKHDCGIVYSEGGDYIICVMTKTRDQKTAEDRIADISLAVYNYFNR